MTLYPATISRRFWAFVIDWLILGFANTIASSVLAIIVSIETEYRLPEWIAFVVMTVYVIANVFYFPLNEIVFGGETLGKRAVKIRVVRSDGSPVTAVHSFQRFLLLAVDVVATMGLGGLISALISDKRQRIGDIVADTVVVNVNPAVYADPDAASANSEYADFLLSTSASPMELAKEYRAMECKIATARTAKADAPVIDYLERLLSGIHLAMFRHRSHTLLDTFVFIFKSVPRAVYSARYAIGASLLIVVSAYAIGIYSQITDPEFFRLIHGDYYTETTLQNIAEGKPMGIYDSEGEWSMLFEIFFNNLFVTLRLMVLGLIAFFGPLYMLVTNFVSFASFDVFFAQQGLLTDALIAPNEHGVLELSTIIVNGGAALLLGTGWLFPGKLTRKQAWIRSARHSMLVFISTIPPLFTAAVIESFVTRHQEWPMAVKLTIILLSAIAIIGYYVVLPILSKRH